MFIVETDTPGVQASELDKVGNHSSSTALIMLDDVHVPKHRILGELGRGLAQLKQTLIEGRILVANRGLAIGAEMAARIDAVRLMIYRAARLFMAGRDCTREASMAKLLG